MNDGYFIKLFLRLCRFWMLFLCVPSYSVDLFYLPPEPLSPSSRNTGIVISEIMYNYGWRPDGRIIEYIELYNSNPYPEDISGYKITGIINYTFPSNTIIGSRQFLVLARSVPDIQAVYGLTSNLLSYGGIVYKTNVVSGVTNIIQEQITISGTGTIQLRDKNGKLLLNVKFSNEPPWPAAADGSGHSLVLARPSYGESDYRAYTISDYRGGSPGRADNFGADTISPIVINEICANPTSGEKFIEIYNRTGLTQNISDYGLTDDPTKIKYKIPRTVYISPYGRYSFPASMLGFSPATMGETIYLFNPAGTRVVDAIKYTPHPAGMSWGRYPDGANGIYLLSNQTSGGPNARFYRPDVVINEIMYAPISGDSDEEYIELYNRGTNTINLGGWQLEGGINFLFQSNTFIPPGGYLVIARNMTNLFVKYNRSDNLCCGKMVGNYSGSLRDSGERIALSKPFKVVTIDQSGNYKTNNVTVPVDELVYGTGGVWGEWAHGGGSSLELIDPNSNGRLGMNWKDSDESNKASWEWMITSLQLEKGKGQIDRLQIYLMEKGECLIDNVELLLFPYNINLLSNSTFETGIDGWQLNGNHSKSTISDNGYQGTKCLHLKAEAPGDILFNNVSGFLKSQLSPDSMVTIRARVRWLHGSTNLVIRLIGNYAEFRIGLNDGKIHGTPGQQNSTFVYNNGPAISEVTHSPTLPPALTPVVISAKVDDPNGISSVTLFYKLNPSTNYSSISMLDNGTGGDKYANDGIFTATLPGQTNGSLVSFYIIATDLSSNRVSSIFPPTNSGYGCLIRFGDTQITNSLFGSYRIWIENERLSNLTNDFITTEFYPVTFVYNNRAIYGARMSYSGEINFNTNGIPVTNKFSYKLIFPEDDQLLGYSYIERLRVPGVFSEIDNTFVRNLSANILAKYTDLPYFNVRLIRFYLNGQQYISPIWEDSQEPGEDYCSISYNSSADNLFYASPWFEFNVNTITNYNFAYFNYRENIYGEQDIREYGVNWEIIKPNAIQASYNNFYKLIGLLNNPLPDNYDLVLGDYINLNHWAKSFAFNKFIGNQSSAGGSLSHNFFVFKPDGGKWLILQRNYNYSLGLNNYYSPSIGDNLLGFNTNDIGVSNFFSSDKIRRQYIQELNNLSSAISVKLNPVITAIDSIFKNENISSTNLSAITNWLYSRNNYISNQIQNIRDIYFSVNLPAFLFTNSYFINITGVGSIIVDSLEINSNIYNLKWYTPTNWMTYLQLFPGTNLINIQALDINGSKIIGASYRTTIVTPMLSSLTNYDNVYLIWNKDFINNYSNISISKPVVINEIMYNSQGPGGDFIEIFNPNTNIFVDLTGFRIDGIGYKFPDGTILKPLEYAVIVEDIKIFKQKYGENVLILGQYSGNLNNFGEKISLTITDNQNSSYIISQVRYEPDPPFPLIANGSGSSLQLINPFEDSTRVANWSAIDAAVYPSLSIATPGRSNSIVDLSLNIPKLWINEIQPDNITGITNTQGIRTGWIEILFTGNGSLSLSNYYLSDNYDELLKWKFPDESSIYSMQPLIVFADSNTTNGSTELHSNFRLRPVSGAIFLSRLVDGKVQVVDYIKYTGLPADTSYGSYPDGQCIERKVFLEPSPGSLNRLMIKLFINEWMASNIAFYDDNADNNFDDWFELYNASYNSVDLSGYYLTDNLTNKTQFIIPDGIVIPARGFLVVWADAEPWQNKQGDSEIHTNFKLMKNGGVIGLYSPDLTLIDSVSFGQQIDNVSQGRYPDGSTNIYFMNISTPGLPNMLEAAVSKIAPIPANPGGVVYLQFKVSNILTNFIRFEPGSGTPADSFLDKDRGIFVWIVPTNQPPGDVNFSIKVCDIRPGATILNIMLTVRIIPTINLYSHKNILSNTFNLSWNTSTQQIYKVQFKANLNDEIWKDWGISIRPTSIITTVTIPITNQSGFFRIISE